MVPLRVERRAMSRVSFNHPVELTAMGALVPSLAARLAVAHAGR